ncbi:hypothetical protein KQX54_017880 [Cotesia glomerata]|uniref:Uncharacterized protein n=1 Tax=Cotesia glomerata TaxID=32391 RepID=A0AAV7HW90_COTGL|nr:hypothetical protein KQX54_017880 [Cotesia glomerata]
MNSEPKIESSVSRLVKTRVLQPSPRRLFAPWRRPVTARSSSATSAEPTLVEVTEAAAVPTWNPIAADPQVALTSTFMPPECPPDVSPAFAAYRASQQKEALERAAKTGHMETGIPRAELMPWSEESDVPIRRKTSNRKKKKKKKKQGLRGPNWSEMEMVGPNDPISEDSGVDGLQ